MKVNCLRRRLNTDGTVLKEWIETHEASVVWHGGSLNSWWIRLSPGVTGYESVSVDAVLKSKGAWPACAGTPGSWDYLGVLGIDMDRLRDALSILPFPELSCLMLFMQLNNQDQPQPLKPDTMELSAAHDLIAQWERLAKSLIQEANKDASLIVQRHKQGQAIAYIRAAHDLAMITPPISKRSA